MKKELKIRVKAGYSSNARLFYFPPPPPELENSTIWVPHLIKRSEFKAILEGVKSPKLREIAIYNLGEFCFEVVKRIVEKLGEKIQELYLKIYALEKARILKVEKEDEVSWRELEPQIIKIIREVWEEQRKNA